jgi:serine protease Do
VADSRWGRRFALGLSCFALLLPLLAACSAGSGPSATPGTRAGTDPSTKLSSKRTPTPSPCTPVPDAVTRVEASVVRIETFPDASGQAAAGTGFVIDTDIVLTNAHVVADTLQRGVSRVITTFMNGRPPIEGQVVATNDAQDLALIQVNTGAIPPIVWGDDRALSKGTPVAAIGYALDKQGPPMIAYGTFQQTYVDAPTGEAYLLTDVALQHGDSGGPLLNECGQVVGVDTAKIRNEDRAGLAIPEYFAQRWATQQLAQQR